MSHLREIKIPIMQEDGLEYLVFRPSEFGDPSSVTLELPNTAVKKKKLQIPRSWIASHLLKGLAPV